MNFVQLSRVMRYSSQNFYSLSLLNRASSRFVHPKCIIFNKLSNKFHQPSQFFQNGYRRPLPVENRKILRFYANDPSKDVHLTDGNAKPDTGSKPENGVQQEDKKAGIFKRFQIMFKKYWYVLVPVHLITSAVWFGSFYYLSVSGVDIAGFLEKIGFGETIVKLMQKYPSGGHLVIAYALYKVATPARYAVTLSGTHFSIKHLSRLGYIKPVPSKEQVKNFLNEKRRQNRERFLKYKQKKLAKRSGHKNGR